MAKVVCNASPIIGLSIIDKIELLWNFISIIPQKDNDKKSEYRVQMTEYS